MVLVMEPLVYISERHVRQNFFEWGLFEIWTMWFLDRVLGGPKKIFETN